MIGSVYYCKQLAEQCERMGKSLSFRMVLTSGDLMDDSTRRLIADSFGAAEVFDNYGIEEVGGSVAWECAEHYGYHVNSESLVVEFLRDGQPVTAGESGDVYVSCFHRKATPILRYFTGDRARRVDDDCPCGRGLHLIREIEGRTMDFIVTSNGDYVSPHIVLMILTHINGVEQFKVSQSKSLSIEIRIKAHQDGTDCILQDVRQQCKRLFNETPLDVKLADRIHTAGPKFRIVESQATH